MIDADMTHIAGTYWNFNGFWRGNLISNSSNITGTGATTLTDLINRTYTLGFTYQSPYSPNVIGVGRVYLPWAPSLSTIDGGYYGRKVNRLFTVGAFAGSTPDPASWSYTPISRSPARLSARNTATSITFIFSAPPDSRSPASIGASRGNSRSSKTI